MKHGLSLSTFILIVILIIHCYAYRTQAAAPPSGRMNILFIASDDLRPQLGCYGDRMVRSPFIDQLAARGSVFGRAYCQQALCSPSRISLLSGLYPSTTGIYTIGPALREKVPDALTLPQHFKNNGYFTRSLGKVYHVGIDDPASWSVPSWVSKKPRYGPEGQAMVRRYVAQQKAKGATIPKTGQGASFYAGPAFESPEVPDDELADGDTAREAVEVIRQLASNPNQPFFLAVGFHNPHVPWVAPKRYWDLYDTPDIRLPQNNFAPKDAPQYAARSGDDFYWYARIPKDRKITPEFGRECLHGYLAAISYVDAQVGRLLDTLEKTGLAKNTIIVFWGDHGYYMGEHGWWGGKHNNYEGATNAPLIVSVPGQKQAGKRADGLVEFVDIYPSLVDICGLPMPKGLAGTSFRPLMDDPSRPGKAAAFSWYPKGGNMGRAMRTDRYRYVEWTKGARLVASELYDHQTDPQENQSISGESQYADLLDQLHEQMRKQGPPNP